MRYRNIPLAALAVLLVGSGAFSQPLTLVPESPSIAQHGFAWYAGMTATKAVVTTFPDIQTGLAGGAYIYTLGATNDPLVIVEPGLNDDDYFGFASAISGNVVVISDPGNPNLTRAVPGAVYTFNASTGAPIATLTAPGTRTAGNEFGFSVSMQGTTVLAGAPAKGTGSGRAYLTHAINGNNLSTFQAPGTQNFSGNEFGYSVDLVSNLAIVGAPVNPSSSQASQRGGSAYVFNATSSTLLHSIQPSTTIPNDEFGWAVASDGTRLIVGAPSRGVGRGNAYIFDAVTGEELFHLVPPVRQNGDDFGYSVDILGDWAVVGAPGDTGLPSRAYLYDTATGELIRELRNPTPTDGDEYGFTVAISSAGVLVGAPAQDVPGLGSGIDVGAAYLFCSLAGDGDCDGYADADFDRDHDVDLFDIDSLVGHIANSGSDARFDLTRDGEVDLGDLSEWLTQAGALNLASGNPYLPGDADLNGFVSDIDFNSWHAHAFTASPRWRDGDFNADGFIDVHDFNIWNAYKHMSALEAAAVPEPAAATSLLLIGLVGLRRRRRP